MWRNHLTVGIRALLKSKTYAFITIFGLALALAPCLIILLFVRYETSYDSWIPAADRVFQMQTFIAEGPGGEPYGMQLSSFAARKALVKDFPQVEKSVWFSPEDGVVVLKNGEASFAEHLLFVDANLFDVLQMPFLKGDPKHALDRPGDMVLTQREASKRFPNQDPMGKTLTLMGEQTGDYRITGIFRDPPKNTHLPLGMIARFEPKSSSDRPRHGYLYVKLRRGADAEAINAQFPAWGKRNIPKDPGAKGGHDSWKLANIRDIHLGEVQHEAMYQASTYKGAAVTMIITFGMIALLILGMAVINFVNLATARGSQRAREVALRKVAGASRRQLIVQFLSESILLTAFAMLLGLAIAELLLPYVNDFLDIDMAIHYFGGDGVLLPILALILAVGTAGGIYPAFYLSRFQPARILKANKSAAEAEGSGRLRSFLVIGQFAVSIGLIICTAVIYAQTAYARTADVGYKREGLLLVGNSGGMSQSLPETLRREVEKISGVRQVGLTDISIDPGGQYGVNFRVPGDPTTTILAPYSVDAKFFDIMGMTLLAGRKFDEKNAMDDFSRPPNPGQEGRRALSARGANIILSELAAKKFGFASPQAAIGKQVNGDDSNFFTAETTPFTIVGVVTDIRIRSVREPLTPFAYMLSTGPLGNMVLRYDAPDPGRILAEVEKSWHRLVPTLPFQGEIVEDRLRELYHADEARGRLFGAFALVAVVIGCLGLFGLAAFTAERRTKEIGIRKVLGARTQDIVRLLAWQFSRPVLIANLIAWPAAWWLMRDWLNGFDTRIALSPAYFLLAGALAMVIAIATIAGHAFKVARAKPIRALRYE